MLLRNQARTLPPATGRQVALFGNTFYDPIAGGTGSGEVNKAYSILLVQKLASAGLDLNATLRGQYERYVQAEKAKQHPSPQLFAQLPVVMELPASPGQGGDRQERNCFGLRAAGCMLVQQVSAAFDAQGKQVVVVLNTGGVLEVASWRDRPDAILLVWQPGQEGGYAIAGLLSGRVNPLGKLAATFPQRYQNVPYAHDFPGKVSVGAASAANPVEGQVAENTYAEGIYVGYRYYTTFRVPPAYESGYGLSYTAFAYGPLLLSTPTRTGQLTTSVTVTNTGPVAGKEVVQLYVGAPAGQLAKPLRELKTFGKTTRPAPGKS